MNLQLRDEDRRAVDLLLDRAASGSGIGPNGAGNGKGQGNGNGHGHAGHAFTPVGGGDMQGRVAGVQKVLQMLDMLPAEDPPQDLLSRTLRRVDTEIANHPSMLRPAQAPLGTSMHQPHA